MRNTSGVVEWCYSHVIGRLILKTIMKLHLDNIAVKFLWSPWSKLLIKPYIKKNQIQVSKEEVSKFRSYREMFIRKRDNIEIDYAPEHLISPCDGWLSTYSIDENSNFKIKNSIYKISDFLQDESLISKYNNGICLVFRLSASDYHHYCYIDNVYQGNNHYIPGILHSVQPIACEKYPVFVLNRRSWCLLSTENFGPVVQCEIGALIVSGIVNPMKSGSFKKGDEEGHFELCGSTIVLLFEENRIDLLPELKEKLAHQKEVRVTIGHTVAIKK